MCRYAHQTGHYVPRRFGWDCHGLPIEHEIDKLHKINSKEDVLKMGIDTYNKECRSIVMRFSKEWEVTVKRCGRWIDFENDYKTMNVRAATHARCAPAPATRPVAARTRRGAGAPRAAPATRRAAPWARATRSRRPRSPPP